MARSRSSPGKGRMVLQTIVLPRICSSSRAASAARNRRSSSLAAHCSNSSRAAAAKSSSGTATKRGSPQQQQQLQYSPSNILRHRSVFYFCETICVAKLRYPANPTYIGKVGLIQKINYSVSVYFPFPCHYYGVLSLYACRLTGCKHENTSF